MTPPDAKEMRSPEKFLGRTYRPYHISELTPEQVSCLRTPWRPDAEWGLAIHGKDGRVLCGLGFNTKEEILASIKRKEEKYTKEYDFWRELWRKVLGSREISE